MLWLNTTFLFLLPLILSCYILCSLRQKEKENNHCHLSKYRLLLYQTACLTHFSFLFPPHACCGWADTADLFQYWSFLYQRVVFNTAHHPDFQFEKYRLGKIKAFSLNKTMIDGFETGPSWGGGRTGKEGEEKKRYVKNPTRSAEDH